mmetsp:Transcript_3465/g.10617  ORF Transcript_3465/g.10617 Transcript_3465/m.10617 type:complete len:284 (-) Transcript_3465:515-1366(-)
MARRHATKGRRRRRRGEEERPAVDGAVAVGDDVGATEAVEGIAAGSAARRESERVASLHAREGPDVGPPGSVLGADPKDPCHVRHGGDDEAAGDLSPNFRPRPRGDGLARRRGRERRAAPRRVRGLRLGAAAGPVRRRGPLRFAGAVEDEARRRMGRSEHLALVPGIAPHPVRGGLGRRRRRRRGRGRGRRALDAPADPRPRRAPPPRRNQRAQSHAPRRPPTTRESHGLEENAEDEEALQNGRATSTLRAGRPRHGAVERQGLHAPLALARARAPGEPAARR